MLRPIKSLTALLVGCLFLFTFILISTTSTSQHSYYSPRRPSSLRASLNSDASCGSSSSSSSSSTPVSVDNGLPKKQGGRPVPTKVTRQVRPLAILIAPTPLGRDRSSNVVNINYNQEQEEEERYLMYVPYAGVTNQLISIWHGSLIAKALNRTLLIPNLSPNVHVESSGGQQQQQEPTTTKWSEFFDLDEYARRTGVKIEELDNFLERRGIVDQATVHPAVDAAITKVREEGRLKRRSLKMMMKKRSEDLAEPGNPHADREDKGTEQESQKRQKKTRRAHKKRWIQFESLVQQSNPIVSKSSSSSSSSAAAAATEAAGFQEPESNQPFKAPTVITSTKKTTVRPIRFPTVQKCFSEAGYGTDRRIDMTGRRFMQRYNIDSTLTPTPFLDPLRDNSSIWSRWRMDKVIERYQQPQYAQEEILCLGHVYRLLPGGNNRVWTEFGQYFRYTERVQDFVDQILEELLPKDQDQAQEQKQKHKVQPFVGLHLRRGDFYRHCLGITSPADPNGWNRCYPSTDHIISLLDSPPTASTKKLPVLVLTNEHDPKELAKADAQHWIRVDHAKLGTIEKFGRYGPILMDGALLARASLLVGVEYSTYFRTASKRAETWYRGQTLFVT
ncbi:hypothetical protein KI688_005063 [Linnemannia hyalina]|uniref:GDP-fucose protein O-fucosyltransferase 2 n=1 Tax=Linnemannia hyalina TaxID=64524 RepID=A0A9P8BRB2_9FUNG|nr:hypothetical protein KI688_005063 [Linnemannia hyalina]